MNISDVCVHTALPVKRFRSLVHKTHSDIGGLSTNEHCNEYTHTHAPQNHCGLVDIKNRT